MGNGRVEEDGGGRVRVNDKFMKEVKDRREICLERMMGGGLECLCIIPFVFWAVLGINNVIHREAIELLSALAGRSHTDMSKNENRTQDH